jgi:hypothetical protein
MFVAVLANINGHACLAYLAERLVFLHATSQRCIRAVNCCPAHGLRECQQTLQKQALKWTYMTAPVKTGR